MRQFELSYNWNLDDLQIISPVFVAKANGEREVTGFATRVLFVILITD